MYKRDERGQSVVLAAILVGFMAFVAVLVMQIAAVANTQAKAQTAADAAALAGVQAGNEGAQSASVLNGARLVSAQQFGDEFQVEVEVGDRSAAARAKLAGGLR